MPKQRGLGDASDKCYSSANSLRVVRKAGDGKSAGLYTRNDVEGELTDCGKRSLHVNNLYKPKHHQKNAGSTRTFPVYPTGAGFPRKECAGNGQSGNRYGLDQDTGLITTSSLCLRLLILMKVGNVISGMQLLDSQRPIEPRLQQSVTIFHFISTPLWLNSALEEK